MTQWAADLRGCATLLGDSIHFCPSLQSCQTKSRLQPVALRSFFPVLRCSFTFNLLLLHCPLEFVCTSQQLGHARSRWWPDNELPEHLESFGFTWSSSHFLGNLLLGSSWTNFHHIPPPNSTVAAPHSCTSDIHIHLSFWLLSLLHRHTREQGQNGQTIQFWHREDVWPPRAIDQCCGIYQFAIDTHFVGDIDGVRKIHETRGCRVGQFFRSMMLWIWPSMVDLPIKNGDFP